jgi:hypothetical protein
MIGVAVMHKFGNTHQTTHPVNESTTLGLHNHVGDGWGMTIYFIRDIAT